MATAKTNSMAFVGETVAEAKLARSINYTSEGGGKTARRTAKETKKYRIT